MPVKNASYTGGPQQLCRTKTKYIGQRHKRTNLSQNDENDFVLLERSIHGLIRRTQRQTRIYMGN